MAAAFLQAPPALPRGNQAESDCLGKHGYPSPALANGVSRRSKDPTEVYRCRRCGRWHLRNSQHRETLMAGKIAKRMQGVQAGKRGKAAAPAKPHAQKGPGQYGGKPAKKKGK